MNDTPHRRSPDGFDDDAIFADIVAHMNDDVTEPERAVRPRADDATTDIPMTDIETTDTKTDTTATAQTPAPGTTDTERSTAEPTPEATELPRERAQPDHDQGDDQPDHDRPDDPDQDLLNQPSGLATSPNDPQSVQPPPQVWRAHEVDDTDEEHFDPPPVSPLPVGDLQFWAIIAGMGGGTLLLLYLVFFNRDASGYWILAAIAMSIAGFALLVSRMPHHHDDDDDGARL